MFLDSLYEVMFAVQEEGYVHMDEIGIVYQLFCSPDLFGFGLLKYGIRCELHHWGDDVPVLKNCNAGLFVFERGTHSHKLILWLPNQSFQYLNRFEDSTQKFFTTLNKVL